MGACDEVIELTPDATPFWWQQFCAPGACVSRLCPPNGAGKRQALSNIAHAVCAGGDPNAISHWQCVLKQDGPFEGPVCPPAHLPEWAVRQTFIRAAPDGWDAMALE